MGNGAVVPDAGKPSMNAPQSNPALTTVNDDQIETALDAMWPSNERYYDDAHGRAEAGMKAALAALSPQPQVTVISAAGLAKLHDALENPAEPTEALKNLLASDQQPQVTEEELARALASLYHERNNGHPLDSTAHDTVATWVERSWPNFSEEARTIIARLTRSAK